MKLRTIALSGVAAVALGSPALAQDPGWYLGIGVGYDHLEPVSGRTNNGFTGRAGYTDNVIFLGSAGYKFDSGLRAEVELSYDDHNASVVRSGTLTLPHSVVSGGESTSSALLNVLYDWQLGENWGVSLGGGVGGADVNEYLRVFGTPGAVSGAHTAFEWQAIGSIYWALSDNVDLTFDYRFRSAEINQSYRSSVCCGITSVHVGQSQEHVGLMGLRWFLGAEAPPPPPPPPPPPAPPPPPPVKTFIVFFDFDKSNLTAEAQSVVSEAVKTAKSSGFVKVLVTGHTDTVGSDSYNQGLSVRRAESVKDEMMRQGMDGSSIAIEGKSFHDPLVPTGPGVREPQNRRAVIDLGGGT
jgi:OOP family OmpA-OmpF porin